MSIHATSTEVYSGKNLCPDVAEGYYVTSTSTGWGKTAVDSGVLIAVEPNTNYTISTTATQSRYRFCFVASLDNYTGYNGGVNDGGSHTYTKNSGSYPYLIVNATDLSKIQVEKGSTATPFEPYVGGVPSPLISGVSHVSTSKNLLNMQSNSNGEYFGTTSQQTYSGKNLYIGSPSFSGYGNISGWTDGGTYNDMPIVKRAGSWSGTYMLVNIVAGKTYTFSAWAKSDQARSVAIYATGGSTGATAVISPGNKTITTSTDWERVIFTFTCSTGGSIALRFENTTNSDTNYTYISGYQLEEASAATSYEPYVGGIPSPNPDYPQEIVVGKMKSKNLFALNKTNGTISDVSYTYNSDGTFSLSGTASAGTGAKSAPIPIAESGLIPGQKYSFWCDHNVGWGSNSCVYYAQSCDSSGNWTGNLMTFTQSGRTATMPSTTTQYVMFVAAISNGSSYSSYSNVKAQLVAGEQVDNVFEPYFTPIELAQVSTYQDKVYKNGNSWYVRKETNSLNMKDYKDKPWYISQYQGGSYVVKCQKTDLNIPDMIFDAGSQLPTSDICNYFTAEPTIQLYQGTILVGFGITTDGIYFSNNSWSVNDFKDFVDTHDVLIYYRKNAPTNTAITDPTTIAWLNKYDTNALPHHKYVNTRRTTYVGASGLSSAIDLYDGSYASTLPTYTTANDHHLTTANGGTYTVSLQNISAKIVSGTVTFSVFTNQRKIDFSWNGSATSTNVSVSLQADEYIKSIYAYIPQDADAGITLSQQLESGSLTDFEPYYNIVRIYAGDDLVFEDTSLTD